MPEAINLIGKEFSLALFKNSRRIEAHIKDIEKIREPSDKYKAIEDKIGEKWKEHADRTPEGEPKTEVSKLPNGDTIERYVCTIPDNKKKITLFVTETRKENEKLFESQEKKINEYISAMNDECSIEFEKISEDQVPDGITPQLISAFQFMIDINP